MRTVPFDPDNPVWQEPPAPLPYVDCPSGYGTNGHVRPYNVDDEIAAWANPGPDGVDRADGARMSGVVVPFPPHKTRGEPSKPQTILVGLDTIDIEPIAWLWRHWLARGKFHIIAGAPGNGKTTICLSWIAATSSGGIFPDATKAPIGNCIIWTCEDGIADTVKPRLLRMGADMTRIKIVRGQRDKNGKLRPFNPATDMPGLIEAAKALGDVAFLILDPVVCRGRASGTK
jgi:hypothetical protein